MLHDDDDDDDGQDEGDGDADDGDDAAQAEDALRVLLFILKEASLNISSNRCWIKETPEIINVGKYEMIRSCSCLHVR